LINNLVIWLVFIVSKAQYTYDAVGNILTQKTGITSAQYATTTYTYDRFGNVLTLTDPLGQTESSTYDLAGNLTSKTDRNGAVTTYGYQHFFGQKNKQVVFSGSSSSPAVGRVSKLRRSFPEKMVSLVGRNVLPQMHLYR
jgi:YD repeat-containing protein